MAALFCAMAMQARAATVTVINTNDSGPGSLRQALANANNGDRINFAITGTITLTNDGLMIDKDVAISGPGSKQLTIDGNLGMYVVLWVVPGKTATISDVTIANGEIGILNDRATLVLSNCVVTRNSVVGLANEGWYDGQTPGNAFLTIANSIVSDNSGGGLGNGASKASAMVMIANSTLTGNSQNARGVHRGGGIYTDGSEGDSTVTVVNSTISDNRTTLGGDDLGGGIYTAFSHLTIVNSTVSGNLATTGGGIYADGGLVEIANSTISGNSASLGGGIYNEASIEISNTIFNAGRSGQNIVNDGGTVMSRGYNVSSDDGGGHLTGSGDKINTNPMLGPLQDNGGPTFTHALLPGSPAIDAGDPSFIPPPYYDQRGPRFRRVFNRRIDIGSFETQPQLPPFPTPRQHPTPLPRPTPPR
jgi:hypothetical protein